MTRDKNGYPIFIDDQVRVNVHQPGPANGPLAGRLTGRVISANVEVDIDVSGDPMHRVVLERGGLEWHEIDGAAKRLRNNDPTDITVLTPSRRFAQDSRLGNLLLPEDRIEVDVATDRGPGYAVAGTVCVTDCHLAEVVLDNGEYHTYHIIDLRRKM